MDLMEVLAKIETEYQECLSKYEELKTKKEKLELIKSSTNYPNVIAKLELKMLAFSNPKECLNKLWQMTFSLSPFKMLIIILIVLISIITCILSGNIIGFSLATFMSLSLGIIIASKKEKFSWIKNTYKDIKKNDNYADLKAKLEEVKNKQTKLDEMLQECESLLEELVKKMLEHYDTYSDVAKVNNLKNPLVPLNEKEMKRVLKYER